jgi:hypothetical protein
MPDILFERKVAGKSKKLARKPRTTANRAGATAKPSGSNTVHLNARPDRLDLRDRPYQPKLANLPEAFPPPATLTSWIKDYSKSKLVLDQGPDGACTGFGLAAVINHLIFRERKLNKRTFPYSKVSAAMLYRLARVYDEWSGEDYDGSSCRGAMKGWHKHGVCSEKAWPHLPKKPNASPTDSKWAEESPQMPLGAYYRIDKNHVADLQSAIHEVGAIYVSAEVHDGWNVSAPARSTDLPVIPYDHRATVPSGLHAFAIVGYTPVGFIVQNSWGDTWGLKGFAILSYNEWLRFGSDSWVAVMGAARPRASNSFESFNAGRGLLLPGQNRAAQALTMANGATLSGTATTPWSERKVHYRSIVIGNNGSAERRAVEHGSGTEAVNAVAFHEIIAWSKQLLTTGTKTVKVALHAHGGLNSEDASRKRISVMGPWFEKNGVLPIFFTWKTGAAESVTNMLRDAAGRFIPGGPGPSGGFFDIIKDAAERLRNAAIEATDRTIELFCSEFLVRALWTEMKTNAAGAGDPLGALALTAAALKDAAAELRKSGQSLELHLIGHSAGSILLGHLLPLLKNKVGSVNLYAPACTVDFANQTYVPQLNKGGLLDPASCKFKVHNLNHQTELADTVGPYQKSLVYLICRALEARHKTPILGMEAAWNPAFDSAKVFADHLFPPVTTWRNAVKAAGIHVKYYDTRTAIPNGRASITPRHGTFDNDTTLFAETLATIKATTPNSLNLTGIDLSDI